MYRRTVHNMELYQHLQLISIPLNLYNSKAQCERKIKMTLLEYLKQLMGRKEPEPAPASVERSEPNEPAATKKQPRGGAAGGVICPCSGSRTGRS